MTKMSSRFLTLGVVAIATVGLAAPAYASTGAQQSNVPATSDNWADHACLPLFIGWGAASVLGVLDSLSAL